jgi:hypothetical protein
MAPDCEFLYHSIPFIPQKSFNYCACPGMIINTIDSHYQVSRPPQVTQQSSPGAVRIDLTGDDPPLWQSVRDARTPVIREPIVLSSDEEGRATAEVEIVNLLTSDDEAGEAEEAPIQQRARTSKPRNSKYKESKDGQPDLHKARRTVCDNGTSRQQSSTFASSSENGPSRLFVSSRWAPRSDENQPQGTPFVANDAKSAATGRTTQPNKHQQHEAAAPIINDAAGSPLPELPEEDSQFSRKDQRLRRAASTRRNSSHGGLLPTKTTDIAEQCTKPTGNSSLTSRPKVSASREGGRRALIPAKTSPIDKNTSATQGREHQSKTESSPHLPVPSDNVPIRPTKAFDDSKMAGRTSAPATLSSQPSIITSSEADLAARSPTNEGPSSSVNERMLRKSDFQPKGKALVHNQAHGAIRRESEDADSPDGKL